MPAHKKYDVTHAPCVVCGVPIALTNGQKRRVTDGKSVMHGGQCKAIHQKRWNAERSRKYIDSLPKPDKPGEVTCHHCKRPFVPLPDVVNRHQRGESHRYFCGACVGKAQQYPQVRQGVSTAVDPYAAEDEARQQIIRDAYFAGNMPDVRHYRRAW